MGQSTSDLQIKELEGQLRMLEIEHTLQEEESKQNQANLKHEKDNCLVQIKQLTREVKVKEERHKKEVEEKVGELFKQVEDALQEVELTKKNQETIVNSFEKQLTEIKLDTEKQNELKKKFEAQLKEIEEEKLKQQKLKQELDAKKNEMELETAKLKQLKSSLEEQRAQQGKGPQPPAGRTPQGKRTQPPAWNAQRKFGSQGTTKKNQPTPAVVEPTHPRDIGLIWTKEEAARLREKVLRQRDVGANILIFGPSGHGKSSLCNGLFGALKDSEVVPQLFVPGVGEESFTQNFKSREIEGIRIVDMCGLRQERAVLTESLNSILRGEVSFDAQLNDLMEVMPSEGEEEAAAGKVNDIPMVLIVLRFQELSSEMKRQLGVVNKLAGKGYFSRHLILTHPDLMATDLKNPKNLRTLYSNSKVTDAMEKMSEETGIPQGAIHVVRNYDRETHTNLYSNLVYLRLLNVIMAHVDDRFEHKR